MAILRHSTADTIKSLLPATDSQHCVRLLEFAAALSLKSDIGHTHTNDHPALTIAGGIQSLSLSVASNQILTGEVRLGTTPGLLIAADGLKLDFGSGVNQAARGNHTHANDHVAAVADPSQTTTATVTVSVDQKIKAAVRLKSNGAVLADSQGLYVDLGTGGTQAAYGNHTHSNASGSTAGFMSAADKTKLDSLSLVGPYTFNDTQTVDLSNTAGVITADVKIGSGTGLKVTGGVGLEVDFTVVAAFGHTHPLATTSTAGLMSAADKTKLDGISGGGGGTNVTIGGGIKTLTLTCGSDQIFTGEVKPAPGGALKITDSGLAADVGSGASQVAAGNHTHANDHVAAAADPSQTDSISVTVSGGQLIKATAKLAVNGGLKLIVGQGLAADTGTASTQVAAGNHVHSNASTSVAGFMSAADKTKLNGLPSSAEVPLTFANSFTINLVRNISNQITATVRVGTGLKVGTTPQLEVDFDLVSPLVHVHDNVTTSTAGFMSAADKLRLDALPDQATLDARYPLLQTGNPTQIQVVNTYLRVNRLYLGSSSNSNFSVDVDNNIVADSNLIILGTLTVGALRLSSIYLLNTTTGNYVPVTVQGAVDAEQFSFGTEVVSAVGQLDVAYFLNGTTGNYVPVTIEGTGDARQFIFGVEVPP